jgi:phenylacetate-CoA ligase
MNALLIRIKTLCLSPLLWLLHTSGFCSTLLMLRGMESVRWRIGRAGAWVQYRTALRRVPAYADLMHRLPGAAASQPTIESVPPIDKTNYVSVFPLEARCLDGVFPATSMLIDESSGSSGKPTNWIRGVHERADNGRTIKRGLQHRLGHEPLFFLNAFALGPWATGINLTLSLSSWARIKTLGPDIAKITNALQQFGTAHHYVIMGYPPFLKQLVDRSGIDWHQYRVSMVFGGEGMSESMRRYLQQKGIARVYGSYGASDLELNIAAETEFTIALRRLLESQPTLAAKVFRHAGALPMIFQFNPSEFFIQSNDEGELLVTICRPRYVAPKVRYNIHDLGHVMRMPELRTLLAEEWAALERLAPDALDLPLLFHYGRSDASVSYYGCKIPPADVQEALFRLPHLARLVDAYQLQTFDDADGDKRLVIALEVEAEGLREGAETWRGCVFDTLAQVNQDFRESRRMVPSGKEPSLELHGIGAGPFAGADIRIKRKYVAQRDSLSGAPA